MIIIFTLIVVMIMTMIMTGSMGSPRGGLPMGRKHSTVMGRAAGAALLTQKTITVSSSSSLSPGRPSAGRAKVDSRDDTLLTGTLHTPCSNGLSMSRPTNS